MLKRFNPFGRQPEPVAPPPAAPPPVQRAPARVPLAQRNLQALSGSPQFPMTAGYGFYTRYSHHWSINELMHRIYESDSFASAILKNIVNFTVGVGAEVDWGDDYSQAMWDGWQWSTLSPHSRNDELQRSAMTSMVLTGDVMKEHVERDMGMRLYDVNPAFVRSYGQIPGEWVPGASKWQDGVIVGDDLAPVAYLYQPLFRGYQSLEPAQPRVILAEDMVHVFDNTDDALMARGRSWMRRALRPLEALAAFDAFMLAAGEISVSSHGYWTIDPKFLVDIDDDSIRNDPVTQAAATAVDELLATSSLENINSVQMVIEGLKWEEQKTSGITEGAVVEAIHGMLGLRVARAVELSPFAVMLDYGKNTGFMAGRAIAESDQRFYEKSQRYLCYFLEEVCDRWADNMMRTDRRFASTWQGWYEIHCPGRPYLDPAKDAKYWQTMIETGAASRAAAMRGQGLNPRKMKAEIYAEREEELKWRKAMTDQYGIDPGPLGKSDQGGKLAGELDEAMQDALSGATEE